MLIIPNTTPFSYDPRGHLTRILSGAHATTTTVLERNANLSIALRTTDGAVLALQEESVAHAILAERQAFFRLHPTLGYENRDISVITFPVSVLQDDSMLALINHVAATQNANGIVQQMDEAWSKLHDEETIPFSFVNLSRDSARAATLKRSVFDIQPLRRAFAETYSGEGYPQVPFTSIGANDEPIPFLYNQGQACLRASYSDDLPCAFSPETFRAIEETLSTIKALLDAWEQSPSGIAWKRTQPIA